MAKIKNSALLLPIIPALVAFIALTDFATTASAAPTHHTSHTAKAPAAALHTEPEQIKLGAGLATINLSPEFLFIDEKTAKAALKAQGNDEEGVLGIIVPAVAKDDDYAVIVKFEDTGHISDDDADKLNADDILNGYKEGTKEQNEDRKQLNLPPIFVGKWSEKPHYDKANHQVIWAIQVKDEDSETAPVTGINYNTRILGRRGVLSLNLLTDEKELDQDKKHIKTLLAETKMNPRSHLRRVCARQR